MSTVYAVDSSFSGTVAGVTFANGQATVTDTWKLAILAELGFGIGSAATTPVNHTTPGGRRQVGDEASVTGSLIVETGLQTVESAVASLGVAAAASGVDAYAVVANQTTYPGRITLYVVTGGATPAAATAAKTVCWMAIGT